MVYSFTNICLFACIWPNFLPKSASRSLLFSGNYRPELPLALRYDHRPSNLYSSRIRGELDHVASREVFAYS